MNSLGLEGQRSQEHKGILILLLLAFSLHVCCLAHGLVWIKHTSAHFDTNSHPSPLKQKHLYKKKKKKLSIPALEGESINSMHQEIN